MEGVVEDGGPVVLFDGVCNLCARSVQTILGHERDRELRFASLQSEAGAALLRSAGLPPVVGDPDSVVLVEGGRAWTASSAAIRIARHLRWPHRALGLAVVVPRPVRDVAYRWVARNRYRWFGRQPEDACWIPKPEWRGRFV